MSAHIFEYKNGRYFRDGKPFFVIGVEYQYYRDQRKNWPERLRQLKESDANTITFYIPWRHHLQAKGNGVQYDFSGLTKDSRDLITFIKLIEDLDLYYIAKPGPFVHSELNIGGLPDIASPSFNKEISPVLTCRKLPLYWEYDHTQLPSPCDPKFDAMAKEWLAAVGEILRPHAAPKGNLIGVQLNDETLYCSSNDAPWNFGYDEHDLQFFRNLLKEKYGDITKYNEIHSSAFLSFDEITGPQLPNVNGELPKKPSDILKYVDWAEYQWKLRREAYERYKLYLNINIPHLSNFAGITPPIEENIPDVIEDAGKGTPPDFARLYPEWWFAMNRVDLDSNVYEYGMISWLGVAAYNIADAKTIDKGRDCTKNEVFNRYINTARRRRGINMEENWGFATLYHPFSKYPLVPFFQTLTSVAGGCTGYVIFTGVQHSYWDSHLDRITKKQHPTFPSDAPITSDGKLTPMYFTMKMMNEWFNLEGECYLKTEQEHDICWLIYPPYAAVSSWIPDTRYWAIRDYKIPRCGVDGLEPLSMLLQEASYSHEMTELEYIDDNTLLSKKTCAIRLGFFMDRPSQEKLIRYVTGGGTLITCGDIPSLDCEMKPCKIFPTIHEGLNHIGRGRLFYSAGEIFSNRSILTVLDALGIKPQLKTTTGIRAFLYSNKEDHYIWCFSFEKSAGPHNKEIEFKGKVIQLTTGSKTAGVIHIRGDSIVSAMFKGVNEVEDITSEIEVSFGADKITRRGDFIFFRR